MKNEIAKLFFKKNLYAIVVLIVLIFTFLYYIPKQNRLIDTLDKDGVYVIGTLIKVKGMKGGQKVVFKFEFHNKIWEDGNYKVIGMQHIGSKFLVKVLPSSPNINEILPQYPIKNKIIHQPYDGWKVIPNEIIKIYPSINE